MAHMQRAIKHVVLGGSPILLVNQLIFWFVSTSEDNMIDCIGSFCNFITDSIYTIILVVYYWVEAILLALVPGGFTRKNVTGDKVLVTGSGSGLGRLLSRRFAVLGCELILWDINEKGNAETAEMVKTLGATAHTYTVDLSSKEAIYKMADQVKADVGDIDILVNNAGIVTGKKFMDSADGLIVKTMEVNLMAHFWTVKSFLPKMIERNHGHLVTIASAGGLVGTTGLADYCASKFGAVGFDESMREELTASRYDGVHTTLVCPFYINTGMFDGVSSKRSWLLPILEPNYVADKIIGAILNNQQFLCIPRLLYFLLVIKAIMPMKCLAVLGNYFGSSSSMDEFKGRSKKVA